MSTTSDINECIKSLKSVKQIDSVHMCALIDESKYLRDSDKIEKVKVQAVTTNLMQAADELIKALEEIRVLTTTAQASNRMSRKYSMPFDQIQAANRNTPPSPSSGGNQ